MSKKQPPPHESYFKRVASILREKFRPVWLPLLGFILLAISVAIGVTIGSASFEANEALSTSPHATWPATLSASSQVLTPVPKGVPLIHDGIQITLLETTTWLHIERDLLPPMEPEPGMIFFGIYVEVREAAGEDHDVPFPAGWFTVLDRNGERVGPVLSSVDRRERRNFNRIDLHVMSEMITLDQPRYVILVYEIENVPHDVLLQWIDPAAKEASPFIVAPYPSR
jgi:hypothetical protein